MIIKLTPNVPVEVKGMLSAPELSIVTVTLITTGETVRVSLTQTGLLDNYRVLRSGEPLTVDAEATNLWISSNSDAGVNVEVLK